MRKKFWIFSTALLLVIAGLFAGSTFTFASTPECNSSTTSYLQGDTQYTVSQFTETGITCIWNALSGLTSIDVLVIGGGGGGGSTGGSNEGGGGGAGGFIENLNVTLNQSDNAISVGAGGSASSNGFNTVAFGYTALGGGSGGFSSPTNDDGTRVGKSGGSGGGGHGWSTERLGGTGNQPSSASGGFGNAGGRGPHSQSGGGGGGADGSGANGSASSGGAGGSGKSSSLTGMSVTYAAGGSGGWTSQGTTSSALGSGGGGAERSINTGASGKNGIVIIRYIAPPSILKIGDDNDAVLTQSPVMLVDPRSSSVAIPFVRLSAATDSRICVDLFTDSSKNTGIELKNTSAASSFHRLAVSNSASGITTSESNTVNSSTGMKLTGNRSNVASMLNPSVSANESYLRLFKPDAGWVDGSVLRIRADYATGSDCSGVSDSQVAMDTQIKIVGIDVEQKNPVDLTRG